MQKFLYCKICGNIVAVVKEKAGKVTCCGQVMEELVPGVTDASLEKHVPEIQVDGNLVTVTVGSVLHPMSEEHYIEWISLQTKQGNQRKLLKPNDEPKAQFALTLGDEVVCAYAYCDLHSLWKKEL